MRRVAPLSREFATRNSNSTMSSCSKPDSCMEPKVGKLVGPVGAIVGVAVGEGVGALVGAGVGAFVGAAVGNLVGAAVCRFVGLRVGDSVSIGLMEGI